MTNRISPFLHFAFMVALGAVWFALYAWSDRVIDLKPGLIICSSDCTDFHNLSDYLLREGRFSPYTGDFHTVPFYWLYIALVAGFKAAFGPAWMPAYAGLMAAALYGAVLLTARYRFGMATDIRVHVAALLALTVGNLTLLTYGRTLLTDFSFALLAGIFFLMAARAWAWMRPRLLAGTLVFALVTCFFRPSGVFLLCIGIGLAIIMAWPAWRRSAVLSALGVVAVGFSVWVFSASMSIYAARNLEAVEAGTAPLAGTMGQFLEFNYTGDDGLNHANRKGALLTNTPYKSWKMNDGGFTGMLGAFVARIPKTFEIRFPNYSRANNIYRIAFYGALFAGAVGFLIRIPRLGDEYRREAVMFAALIAAYLLIFVAMSHVTLRFRLVFDVSLAIAAANFYAGIAARIFRRTRAA
jgi:hypothetical protein